MSDEELEELERRFTDEHGELDEQAFFKACLAYERRCDPVFGW